MNRFADQVVIVTGGANPLTEALLESFKAEGAEAFYVAFDSDPALCTARVEEVARVRGRLDVLVTNHFLPMPASALLPAAQLTPDEWEAQQKKYLHVPYCAAHTAGKIMLAQGRGNIVHIGPVHGLFAQANLAAYCSAAGALFMLTRALAVEWAANGVRVNAVACGILSDEDVPIPEQAVLDRIPMGRRGEYSEIVQGVLFAAGDEASFMTGDIMRVDGGWTAYHLFVPFEGAF